MQAKEQGAWWSWVEGWQLWKTRQVEGDQETGKEATLLFLSSSGPGLLCSHEPRGSLSWSPKADTQAEVTCLGLGCYRKQEVQVISQEGLTLENWRTPKVGWESLAQVKST